MNEHEHSDPSSHVYQHNVKDEPKIDLDNLKILDRESNYFKFQFKEMLLIGKNNLNMRTKMSIIFC